MLTVLDAKRPAVLVFPELSPGRAIALPRPPLPWPRSIATLDDTCVVADHAGGGLARWNPGAGWWSVTHAGVFAQVTAIAAGADGRLLVADRTGLHRIELDGSLVPLYSSPPGERCIGVAVAGDGRVAVTLNPARLLISEDDGASWLELAGVGRPGSVAGLPTGFAVVDAMARTVEVLRSDAPQVSIGAAGGLHGPIAVAPAENGVVIADAVTGRVRRYVLIAELSVAAEFVDSVTLPTLPPFFERVIALAAPMPTGVL